MRMYGAMRSWLRGGCGLVFALAGCSNGSAEYPKTWSIGDGVDTEQSDTEAMPPLPWLHTDGNRIENELGEIVILRGVSTIDLGTTNGYPEKALGMIDRLTDKTDTQGNSPGWYTTVIRLAIYPADSNAAASPFTYTPNNSSFYEQLLRPVVERCRKRGVYAIIDWHGIDDTDEHRETTAQFWRDMAPRFANDSNVLFELFNEPINRTGGWASLRGDMQAWYDIVRQAAPENLVLVGTPSWCQQLADTVEAPIDGRNVVYVSHVYPYHFGVPSIVEGIRKAHTVHPVFMSEWGFQEDATDSTVRGTVSSYGEPFKRFVEELGLSWTVWCASDTWYPAMFNSDFTLRTGDGFEGTFAKDWLYESRHDHPPIPWP